MIPQEMCPTCGVGHSDPDTCPIRPKKSDGLRDTSGRQITTTGKLVNQYARSGEKKSKED